MSVHQTQGGTERRALGRSFAIIGLSAGLTLTVLQAASPLSIRADAGGPTVAITAAGGTPLGVPVPLGPCPSGEGSDYCVAPDPATANVGDTVTWVNNSGAPHHLEGTGVNTHQTFAVNVDGPSGSATFTVSDTYSYTDSLHPEVRGSLIVSPSSAASAPTVAPPAAQAGQSLGQVTGAGAAKPHVVAAAGLGIVTGPPDVGPPGSKELPPITASPSADPEVLPAIDPSPSPTVARSTLTAGTAAAADTSWKIYAEAALLALLVVGAVGSAAGLMLRRRRPGEEALTEPWLR